MTQYPSTPGPNSQGGSGCCGSTSQQPSQASLTTRLKQLASPWTLILALPLSVALLDPGQLTAMLGIAGQAFLGTLPFIIVAVALIAGLKASGAEVLIARAFEGRENRMILLAALFGGLAPFCSCEVIPFIAGLLAVGTPLPAVMAFWLSSPLIDPPSLVITAGALGWPFAVGRAVIAVSLGLFGGFVLKTMMSRAVFQSPLKRIPAPGCGGGLNRGSVDWRFWQTPARVATFQTELKTNSLFLVKWLAFAYLLEAVFILYVPAEWVATLVGGDGLAAVAIGAAVGLPAYLNGYAAPALVAGFMEQGMTAGAAMAFMTAGAISSIPAMTAVWSLVKPQVFAAYLGLGFAGAVALGWLFGTVV